MVSLGLRGPDSLPGSRGMLVLCLVPWVAVTALGYLMLLPASAVFVLPVMAFELLLLLGYSRFILLMAGKPERWPQTLVSLLGVQAIINALNLPLVYVVTSQEEPGLLLQAAEYGFLHGGCWPWPTSLPGPWIVPPGWACSCPWLTFSST